MSTREPLTERERGARNEGMRRDCDVGNRKQGFAAGWDAARDFYRDTERPAEPDDLLSRAAQGVHEREARRFSHGVEYDGRCECGHTAEWHSHEGRGSCEHDSECECECARFEEQPPDDDSARPSGEVDERPYSEAESRGRQLAAGFQAEAILADRTVSAEQRLEQAEQERDQWSQRQIEAALRAEGAEAKQAGLEARLVEARAALERIGGHAAGSANTFSDRGRMLASIAEDAERTLARIQSGEETQ